MVHFQYANVVFFAFFCMYSESAINVDFDTKVEDVP